jgi:serine acetyltransferase
MPLLTRYILTVSAYGITIGRTYHPHQRLTIDHGIGVIAHRTGIIDHGQQ